MFDEIRILSGQSAAGNPGVIIRSFTEGKESLIFCRDLSEVLAVLQVTFFPDAIEPRKVPDEIPPLHTCAVAP